MLDQRCGRTCVSVCLTGALLLLLPLNTVTEVQYDYYGDSTAAPDYQDYNATFEYSFFSNASSEDWDRFLGNTEEGTVDPEEEVTVTMTTVIRTTERVQVPIYNSAPPPRIPVIRTVVCSLLMVLGLTVQQLEHTL